MARYRNRLLASASLSLGALAAALLPLTAYANPQDGQVSAGEATISTPSPMLLQVNQASQKAVIDWRSFNIGQGETTQFVQPNAAAIALNRVGGGDPSQILGNLRANGQVWLVNPNGIVFGKTAQVDVAGLLATTLNIRNEDFLSGNYRFFSTGQANALVINAGHITVRQAGLAALVAPGVENSGVIEARLGTIQLASASGFTLDLYGDGKFNFLLSDKTTGALAGADGQPLHAAVSNSGSLIADGGAVLLTANVAKSVVDQAINMDGYIQARSIGSTGGQIVLDGGEAGMVAVAGTLDASGKVAGEIGGTAHVTGETVALASTAAIDASGDAGGGSVLVGGDYHGGGTLRTATNTTIAAGATIQVDALQTGSGGNAVVWSDNETTFAGTISARGGAQGGNGGSAEVSGHDLLNFNGQVDLRAPSGLVGTLLLDPRNVVIQASGSTTTTPTVTGSNTSYDAGQDDSILTVANLQTALGLGNVTVTTGSTGSQAGDITVASSFSWSSPTALSLLAYRNIIINSGVSITNPVGGTAVRLTLAADTGGTGTGVVSMLGTASIALASGGSTTIFYDPPGGYTSPMTFPGISRTPTAYMLVNTASDLQNVALNRFGNFALNKNLDLSSIPNFTPIGTDAAPFFGIFNGNGFAIDHMTINSAAAGPSELGLFARLAGSVVNLGLTNVSINDSGFGGSVGAVAGRFSGSALIGSVYATGTISAPDAVAGGLVGSDFGGNVLPLTNGSSRISSSSSAVSVTAGGYAGGISGSNDAIISNSHSTGSVSGSEVGGIAGLNNNQIVNSYSTAAVTGDYILGGLVGFNGGSITTSYASGSVSGTGGSIKAGGLVGIEDGSIAKSYATGSVNITSDGSGANYVGGLIGNAQSGLIDQVFSSGQVTADPADFVGGLIGNIGSGTLTNAYWDKTTSHQTTSAGGVALQSANPVAANYAFSQSSYVGFDFTSAWFMVDGATRPFLQSEFSLTITNAHQLQLIDLHLGSNSKLGNDIDLSELSNPAGMWNTATGFSPIGLSSPFTGTFDGQGHQISNLTINQTTGARPALFATTGSSAIIQNLRLTNVSVTGVGGAGLVGTNNGQIINSSTSGTVTSLGGAEVGGLVANNSGSIVRSFSSANVTGDFMTGGLVGDNQVGLGSITDSYATGSVSGSDRLGGLVGYGGSIFTSYATGLVQGVLGSGGLISAVNSGYPVTNSYWDTQTTGQATSAAGTGLTTAQLTAGLPIGFDPAVWTISAGVSYPYLKWQTSNIPLAPVSPPPVSPPPVSPPPVSPPPVSPPPVSPPPVSPPPVSPPPVSPPPVSPPPVSPPPSPPSPGYTFFSGSQSDTFIEVDFNSSATFTAPLAALGSQCLISCSAGFFQQQLYDIMAPVEHFTQWPPNAVGYQVYITNQSGVFRFVARAITASHNSAPPPISIQFAQAQNQASKPSTPITTGTGSASSGSSSIAALQAQLADLQRQLIVELQKQVAELQAQQVPPKTVTNAKSSPSATTQLAVPLLPLSLPAPSFAMAGTTPATNLSTSNSKAAPLPSQPVTSQLIYTPGHDASGQQVDLWSNQKPSDWAAAGAALTYAKLSDAIYQDAGTVDGWTKVATWQDMVDRAYSGVANPAQLAVLKTMIAATGFDAAVYEKTGQPPSLVFRGTNGILALNSLLTDALQVLGIRLSTQYDIATTFGKLAQEFYPGVVATGHSLGGGLAQYVSWQVPGIKAVTFNAAGIGGLSIPTNLASVVNISVDGDPVSPFGTQLGANSYKLPNPSPLIVNGAKDLLGSPGYLYFSHSSGGASVVIDALTITWSDGVIKQAKR